MARLRCAEDNYAQPLLAIAAHGLPGSTRTYPTKPLDDESWRTIRRAAQDHRVTGLLVAAVKDGAFPATAAQFGDVRGGHVRTMLRVMSLEQELLELVGLLDRHGINHRVLKGTAVAHLDYADPALRSFIDLDVLVRADDFERTVRVLTDAGFVRTLMEPAPGFDRRFDKGTTLIGSAGYELDLHRTFVLGPWGLVIELEDLWRDGGQEFIVAGRPVRALSRDTRFMHACYHAALGDWPLRLSSLRDVVEMLLRIGDDAGPIRQLAARWHAEAVVAAAIADANRLLGIAPRTELERWAAGYPFSRREEARLALHTHPDKTFAAQALSTLVALPRLRDKADYLRALLLPEPQYVADRHPSALARFRYGIREVRRGRARRR